MKKYLLALTAFVMIAGCSVKTEKPDAEELTDAPGNEILPETAYEPSDTETEFAFEMENGSLSLRFDEENWHAETKDGRLCILPHNSAEEEEVKTGLQLFFDDGFAVCGTGLVTKEVTINGIHVQLGYYDGSKEWEFAVFKPANKTKLALIRTGANWTEQLYRQTDAILQSIEIAQ